MTASAGLNNTLTADTHIPGPRGSFLLGSVPEFRRDQLGFVQRMQREFGAVARYRLGSMQFIQVNHPDGVQRILQEINRNYVKGEY